MKTLIPFVVCLAAALAACGPTPPSKIQGNGTDPNQALPDTGAFPYTLVGRFQMTNPNTARFDWSNSSIGATFTGTSLAVNIADEGTNWYGGTTPVQNLYDVVIDGNTTPQILQIVKDQNQYPLASGLAPGNHTVWLHKRTEAQIGISDFSGFVTDGNFLQPPAPPTRNIEIVGDSGDTGYGADANVTTANMCTFTAATENADFSYPQLLANQLNAALTNVSFSGKGITTNLAPGDTVTLPMLEQYTVAGDGNVKFQSKGNQDVVLIDAGGDDLQGPWGSGTINTTLFVSSYVQLIQTLRSQEPHAIIIGSVTAGAGGNDPQTLGAVIQQAVTQVNQAGDPNVFYFAFQPYDGSVGYGCDYHPNHAGAALIAGEVAPFIKSKLGW